MPTPEVKLEILATTVDRLREAGYEYIGMDHFAKPDDPLTVAWKNGELHRNFQGYTTMPNLEMIGFGMSAISMLDGLYVQNHSKLETYDEAIGAGNPATWRGYRLTADDRLRRNIINRLMCRYVVDLPLIESETGEDFDTYFPGVAAQLNAFVDDGLLEHSARAYRVTEMGRFLLRNIAMVFDAYLPDMLAKGKARFSRTV
jgi:oxygen-independent coproporphyrinogen-3 oxidase